MGTIDPPRATNYAFHKADWKKYKELIYESTPQFKNFPNTTDLDEAISNFTKIIQDTADACIPKFTPAPPDLRVPPPHILAIIRQRNNIKNSWYRTKNPDLKRALNSLTNQVRSLMQQWKTSLWHDTLNKTHGDHRKFWKLVKTRVTKRRSVLIHDRHSVLDTSQQAEILATHMSTDSQSRVTAEEEAVRAEHVRNYMFVSPKQLSAILRRTAGNKSPGVDKVQYVLLRQFPRKTMAYFAHLINSCLRHRHFPTEWKHAIVVPLRKPAKTGDSPEHYRPISLLPHMSKIFEKVILKYLNDFCDEENIIPPEQTGFRTGLSTEHPILRLQSHITKNMSMNTPTAMISIDCSKAFDSVNHDILLNKLKACGCPEQLYNVLHSYLRGRTFSVRVGDSISQTHPLPCGVPQGSVLAPVLFCTYTGHIVGRHYPNVQISAYADDIAIYGTSLNATIALRHAESACADICDRLKKLNITVNPSKTDAIIFSFQKKKKRLPKTFRIDNAENPVSGTLTYLGVHLDRHLTFCTHVSKKLRTARTRFYSLRRLLLTPNLSLRLKLLIYKAVLRPTFLYGTPVFRYLTRSSFKNLQGFQNNVLKTIVQKSAFSKEKANALHERFNLPKVNEFIKRRHVKFFDSLQYLNNPLFNSLTPPVKPQRWQGAKHPRLEDVFDS